MTRIALLLTGAVAILVLAAIVLVALPTMQLDVSPSPALRPYAGSVARGRAVYVREGCVFCHSQQVRDPAIANDERRGWGRPSVPSDYVYDEPHLLGTMRTGPDLTNVAQRLPDRQWHLVHLYQPRAIAPWSVMPSYRYLFETKPRAARWEVVVELPPELAPRRGVVVASQDATALVDYLLSLDRSFPPSLPPEAP